MRLTLRTLLAYLDNVFEPEDAAILKKKIEESDFAKTLVERIRSASSRRKLGAPNILGRGIGVDPNTVAQYLDSTLPPDRVPDLERICLESDVHLAEVAACHQILTLVLTEAIEVEPELRQRMYEIGAPKAIQSPLTAPPAENYQLPPAPPAASPPVDTTMPHGHAAVPPAPPEDPLAAPVSRSPKPHKELPEYLKAGQRSMWKPLAITLVVAFLASAMILRAFGPFNAKHPILRLFGGGSTEVASVSDEDQTDNGKNDGSDASDSESALSDTSTGSSVDDSSDPSGGATGDESATESTTPVTSSEPEMVPEPGSETGDAVPPGESPVMPAPGTKTEPTVECPDTKPAIPQVEVPGIDSEQTPVIPEKPATGGPAGIEVGFVKTKDLHFPLRFDPTLNQWHRLPSRSKLMSGDRLRVLPTYRPELVLAPGVQVMFAGPSAVELQAPTPNGEPGIDIEFGRAFISTAGVPGAKLHLMMGDRHCVVTFVDAASELALEVRHFLPPGANPEQDTTLEVARAFVTIGRVEWQDSADAPPATITENQVRVLVDDKAQTLAAGEIPLWVLGENLREIDRGASTTLESYLVADRPITLSLKERLQDRRVEIRALAAMCLSYLGSFEGLLKELNDSRQRSYWSVEFDTLRAAISRSPETAAQIHMILGTLYPNEADQAYRLLAGYSPQELHEGADQFLVDSLESDSLPLRILAFENLRRITDSTEFYRPYVTDELRRSSVRGWRDRLENQGIVYDTLPVPTSDRW